MFVHLYVRSYVRTYAKGGKEEAEFLFFNKRQELLPREYVRTYVRTYKFLNFQIFRFSDFQIFGFSDFQIFRTCFSWIRNGDLDSKMVLDSKRDFEFEKGREFENIDFFKKLSHERVLPSRIWITDGLG